MPRRTQNDDAVLTDTADGPVRLCAAGRERLSKAEMIRFVRAPDGAVVPDLAEKLPGRGVWVRAERAAIDKACKTGAFGRGLKASVTMDPELSDQIEQLLIKRLQNTLGLAKKAGAIVLGFDQVRSALQSRPPGTLIEASDGGKDGRNKLYFLAKALYEPPQVSGALSSDELGMAFGRTHVVHACLERGAFSRNWQTDYSRLTGFRTAPELEWYSGTH